MVASFRLSGIALVLVLVVAIGVRAETDVEEGKALLGYGKTQEALALFLAAAERGEVEAEHALGDLYCYGHESSFGTIEVDYARANYWYGRAGKQGESNSQWLLGKHLLEGTGAPVSPRAGVHWLRLASRNGHPAAQRDLARHFTKTVTNLDEALVWIDAALETRPGESDMLDAKGWLLHKMGRNEEAVGYLRRAVAKVPSQENSEHLAVVKGALGEAGGQNR
jgi:TPR repeat protein